QMRRRVQSTGLAAFGALIALAQPARAHGDVDVERPSHERTEGASPEASVERPSEAEEGEAEERAEVSLDLVLGWGRVPFAVQNLPPTGNQTLTYPRNGAVDSDVQSLILAGSFKVLPPLAIGLRVPLTFAGFSPSGSPSRSTAGIGNLELEAECEHEFSKM